MNYRILEGDALQQLRTLPEESVHCVVTSPPYWGLRDYSVDRQIGQEKTPEEYVAKIVDVFTEVRRVLRGDGTLWLNLGDSYANDGKWGGATGGKQSYLGELNRKRVGREKRRTGLKPKDLVGIPWMIAFALRADGWWLRQDIIWSKPNPMPESVTDRCTKSHEYLFLLSKSARYYYDREAIMEPLAEASIQRLSQNVAEQLGSARVPWKANGTMKAVRFGGAKYGDSEGEDARTKSGNEWEPTADLRNKRSVWEVVTQGFKEAHFATFPTELVKPCILAGSPESGWVLDPFCGSGTTGLVALRHGRNFIGIELNPEYVAMTERRIQEDAPMFNVRENN